MNVEIVLEIILILIGLYLAMFKSYFQEKGKNIATSQDIEDLTLKVESVKQQFLEKNANLKAKLDLLTNLQISHKTEERLALIDFHKKIKSWIGLLTESSPSLVDDYNNEEIQSKIHSYELTFRQVLSAEALLELYVDDEQLTQLISELKIKVLEVLAPYPLKCLLSLKHNNFKIKQLDFEQNLDLKSAKHEKLLDERIEIYEDYRKNMINGYKEVIVIDKKYREYVRNYITKISSE